MLIIDQLQIDLEAGLNVLTGETGAGKSILLDCLGFVLGWRGRADLVRKSADQGEVSACFILPSDHPAHDILRDAGFESGAELMLRRINTHDGRKTAFINDRRCTGDLLRRLGDSLIELHGQHDDRGLLNPSGHRDLLDAFAASADFKAVCKAAWRDLAQKQSQLDAHIQNQIELAAEEEFIRHAVAELAVLGPQKGEEAQLDAHRRTIRAAGKIRDDIVQAAKLLGGEGAEGKIFSAMRMLEDAASHIDGQLDDPIAGLSRGAAEISEVSAQIEDLVRALNFNEAELEETEDRLFAIRGLARKHDVMADGLPDLLAGYQEKLDKFDQGGKNQTALQDAVKTAKAAYTAAADALSECRQKGARDLDAKMANELAPLKMERAIFETIIERGADGASGYDQVAFKVATNPGAPAGALNKIASGGELSRFLLALKVCLSAGQTGLTLIFDEIDRGVGGATADAVGRRLSALGQGGQVLVVTHSPQVAALGNWHWRVEKEVLDNETFSRIVALGEDERIDEIARMLSADEITTAARAAAKELLKG